MKCIIMDAGPLVAWFCPRDEHHPWASQAFTQIQPGGLICEAVLTEVCHLAAKEGVRPGNVLGFVESGGLSVIPLGGELPAIRSLMEHYADASMDFADACVLRLAELHPGATVCTTDSDFRFYRKNEQEIVTLLAPFVP